MLQIDSYDSEYVEACRTRLYEQLGAVRQLRDATDVAIGAAWEMFEQILYRNLVLALDRSFVDRARAREGTEPNALTEVRLLCIGILEHDAILSDRPTIPHGAETSITGIEPGEPIVLDEAAFARLADSFLDEIERRYT